jgi:hypothetical protein
MKAKHLPLLLVVCLPLTGCNAGNAPETMSESDVQSAIKKLSPQEQIDYINRSPLTPDEKKKRIAEIEKSSGVTAAPGAPTPGGQ